MLRYTLFFLLINSYGRSLGVPVRKESSNGTILIGNLLNDLSKQCKNEFVLSQIENRNVSICDVELGYQVVPLRCLMFYDANRVLCNVTGVSAADLATDFTAKVSRIQNVTTFCSEAAYITVPEAAYQRMINFVFQSEVACTNVCTDEDISTGRTNFLCKYYKWALSKLDAVSSSTHVLKTTAKPPGSGASGIVEQKNDATAVQASHVIDGQLKVASDKLALHTPSEKNVDPNEHPSEVAKQESSSVAQLTSIQQQESSKLQSETLKKSTQVAHTQDKVEGEVAADLEYQPNPDGEPIIGGNNEAGSDNNAGGMKDIAVLKIETQQQKTHLDNDDNDTGVDTEDDDARDDNLDTGGDDGEDPIINEPALKNEPEVKNSDKQIETQSLYGEGSQREYIPNTGGFADDDDHFFPFFLTAVIVVVVLYVLYHNKSKVGKLIFGLIVEGRQTGRRRNSRGHAYRRLDTLEQAMSANTAAPPSKIIY